MPKTTPQILTLKQLDRTLMLFVIFHLLLQPKTPTTTSSNQHKIDKKKIFVPAGNMITCETLLSVNMGWMFSSLLLNCSKILLDLDGGVADDAAVDNVDADDDGINEQTPHNTLIAKMTNAFGLVACLNYRSKPQLFIHIFNQCSFVSIQFTSTHCWHLMHFCVASFGRSVTCIATTTTQCDTMTDDHLHTIRLNTLNDCGILSFPSLPFFCFNYCLVFFG
ncbi:hypothetical protein CVS40_12240 [Lucilia cuprina]|nr:hypothetical protein CVS40_12240 [Lucilia cuprina]